MLQRYLEVTGQTVRKHVSDHDPVDGKRIRCNGYSAGNPLNRGGPARDCSGQRETPQEFETIRVNEGERFIREHRSQPKLGGRQRLRFNSDVIDAGAGVGIDERFGGAAA